MSRGAGRERLSWEVLGSSVKIHPAVPSWPDLLTPVGQDRAGMFTQRPGLVWERPRALGTGTCPDRKSVV